jgi:superfamily II helicase
MTKIENLNLIELYSYVQDLKKFRVEGNTKAIRGRTEMIFNVIDKLRKSTIENTEDIIERALSDVNLAYNISTPYKNICWKCYGEDDYISIVDSRLDVRCAQCNWFICSRCGFCRDSKRGICSKLDNPH